MDQTISRLRLAVVLLTGVTLLHETPDALGSFVVVVWGAAVLYASTVALAAPYRWLPLVGWHVVSGFIDWALIGLGILATGGQRSDLHLLYFLSVLSIAMRYGLREVMITGVGTAVGYLALLLLTASTWPPPLQDAGLRMGYLLLFAVGSGVLAREARRQLHARLSEEAQRLSVQEVTATVSHDLRTPLTAVTGLVEILLDSTVDTLSLEQRALLHRINANAQQMGDLVSNLLDAELIERGQLPFRPEALDLNALVRRVVEVQAHQAEQKQIGLVLDLSPRIPVAVLDSRIMERLVANLLSNAIKFTPMSGAIRVSTRSRSAARVIVEVWDSGPDVPEDLQSVLFEKFVRQPDSPGVGLGLYICRSIVEMHRGTIAVSPSAGGGVAFVVELPTAHAPALRPQAVEGPRRAAPEAAVAQARAAATVLLRG